MITVKEKLVEIVQNETKVDLITACEYVQKWMDNFMNSNKKKDYVNIGQRRLLIEKK